jgi:hypothetical protein
MEVDGCRNSCSISVTSATLDFIGEQLLRIKEILLENKALNYATLKGATAQPGSSEVQRLLVRCDAITPRGLNFLPDVLPQETFLPV